MKRQSITLLLFFVSVLLGCTKNFERVTNETETVKRNVNPGVWQAVEMVNGNYVCGNLNFGATFTHPSSITSYQHGNAWGPAIGGVSSTSNLLSFDQHGNKYVAIFGTFVNGLPINTNGLGDFTAHLFKYYDGDTTYPSLSDYITRAGGTPNGELVTEGQFVLDQSSPTYVSIAPISYVPTSSSTNTGLTIDGYLGEIDRGDGVKYELTGYSGVVTAIDRVSANGGRMSISNFSGYYLLPLRLKAVTVDVSIADQDGTFEYIAYNIPF